MVFFQNYEKSLITPIFKSGAKDDARNYRPIFMLNIMAKIFERIVSSRLSSLIHHYICDEQHGFVQDRSTVTNLAIFNGYISSALDFGQQVNVIYTDFSKAFDSVGVILRRKLKLFGFRGNILSWLRSYLKGRIQVVRVKDEVSYDSVATSYRRVYT